MNTLRPSPRKTLMTSNTYYTPTTSVTEKLFHDAPTSSTNNASTTTSVTETLFHGAPTSSTNNDPSTTSVTEALFHDAATSSTNNDLQKVQLQLTNALLKFLSTNETKNITQANILATFKFFMTHPDAPKAHQLVRTNVNMKLYKTLQDESGLKENIRNVSVNEQNVLKFSVTSSILCAKQQLNTIKKVVTDDLTIGLNRRQNYLDERSRIILGQMYTDLFEPVTPQNPAPSTSQIIDNTSTVKIQLPQPLENSTGIVISGDSNGSIACDTVTLLSSGQITLTPEAVDAVIQCLKLEAIANIPSKKIHELNQQLSVIQSAISEMENKSRHLDDIENVQSPDRRNKNSNLEKCRATAEYRKITAQRKSLIHSIKIEVNARYATLKNTPIYEKLLNVIIDGIKLNPFHNHCPAVIFLGDRYFERLGNANCTAKFDQKLAQLGLINTDPQVKGGTIQLMRGNKDFRHTEEELSLVYDIPHLNPETKITTLNDLEGHQLARQDSKPDPKLYYISTNNDDTAELSSVAIPLDTLTNTKAFNAWLNEEVKTNPNLARVISQSITYSDVYQPPEVQENLPFIYNVAKQNTIMAAHEVTNNLLFNHQGIMASINADGTYPKLIIKEAPLVGFAHTTVNMENIQKGDALVHITTELNAEKDRLADRERNKTGTPYFEAGVNQTLTHNQIEKITTQLPHNMQGMSIFYGHHNTTNGLNPTSHNKSNNISAYGLNPSVYDPRSDNFYPHMIAAYIPGDSSVIIR
ncbi:MAG: hypothetical protein KBD37_00985 [Burkholderiales bacterium]|nr:hypothetical protein [Burkholderiales bacterium]